MSDKAKESAQVQKARKKIKDQLADAEKRINPEALHEMARIIQLQLSRRSSERINLKNKTVTLFDENQHSAKTESKFVNRLLKQIKQKIIDPSYKQLEGRVKLQNK